MSDFLQERMAAYDAEAQNVEAQVAAIHADLKHYGQGAKQRVNKAAEAHGRFTARQGERMGKAAASAIDFEIELPTSAKILPW